MIHTSPYPPAEIPDVPFTDYLFERAGEHGDRTAIVCGATGRACTYGQLQDGIRRVSAGLHVRGVRKGDVVAIVSPNVPEFAIAFHAIGESYAMLRYGRTAPRQRDALVATLARAVEVLPAPAALRSGGR